MTWVRRYRNIGDGNPLNVAQNIFIDDEDTNIPKNLPTFIVGSKNAGKSTLISTLIKAEVDNSVYSRIIYIYTDHVDTTLAETCHETLIRVPLNHSIQFIKEYFKIKSEYMSWIKFIDKNKLNEDSNVPPISQLTAVYTDNTIDEYIRRYLNVNIAKGSMERNPNASKGPPNVTIKNHAIEFVLKYSQPWEIQVEGVIYHLEGLLYDQYDQLIIDDVGVAASYLFPNSVQRSPLYPFLTISRHILLGTIIAGQDLLQLPKYARKEINTYLFGIGIDIFDIEKTNVPANKQQEVLKEFDRIQQYDFVFFNGVNNQVGYLIASK